VSVLTAEEMMVRYDRHLPERIEDGSMPPSVGQGKIGGCR
jgi:hypothetical protein